MILGGVAFLSHDSAHFTHVNRGYSLSHGFTLTVFATMLPASMTRASLPWLTGNPGMQKKIRHRISILSAAALSIQGKQP
jgi:hypothetical protein